MFYMVGVTEQMRDYARIMALYERAFPENERRPLKPLLEDTTGCSDFLAFYEDDALLGFACLLSWKDITHILYIAMEEEQRGRGCGGQALEAVCRVRPGNRILADIEDDAGEESPLGERRRRKQFYLKRGFMETEVAYRWREEDYVILSQGGPVTKEEFWAFWHYFECENTAFSEF